IAYVNGVLQVTSAPPPSPTQPAPDFGTLPENAALLAAIDRSGEIDELLRDRDALARRIQGEPQDRNICR
ncbi:MAG TPA: hypothetical protein VFR39_04370, partial [Burkholderiales bacterium]|nr:hypothetical protein [Burkholderiales bacterium]